MSSTVILVCRRCGNSHATHKQIVIRNPSAVHACNNADLKSTRRCQERITFVDIMKRMDAEEVIEYGEPPDGL